MFRNHTVRHNCQRKPQNRDGLKSGVANVWLSGNVLVSINVRLYSRLVRGWVTILEWASHISADPGIQIN